MHLQHCIYQEFLHVGSVGVESDVAAHGQAEGDQHASPVIPPQLGGPACATVRGGLSLEFRRLGDVAPQPVNAEGQDRAQYEG